MKILSLVLCFCFFISSPALGTVVWDESVDGDLSGAFGSPDLIFHTYGQNTIIGQVGSNGNTGATNGSDADYFTIAIPLNLRIDSVTIDSYTFSPGDPGSSFFGITGGFSFSGQAAGDVSGSTLFNASSGEVIDDLAGVFIDGVASYWIQETSPNIVNYQITFNVIPEPTSSVLLFLAGGFLTMRRRK